MSDKIDGIYSFSAPVSTGFSNLFEPRKYIDPKTRKESGEPKYDCMFVHNPDCPVLKEMKEQAAKVAKAANFTDEEGNAIPFSGLQFPFKSGDKIIAEEKAEAEKQGRKSKSYDFMIGKVVVTARTIYVPRLSVLQNGKVTDYKDEARLAVKDKFYNGVQVLAELNFVSHKVGSNKPGVTAYLNAVLSLNKGERIGGGRSGQETFSSYVGKLSATDPTEGMATADEEIPF